MSHPNPDIKSRGPGCFGPIAETRRLRIKISSLHRALRTLDNGYVAKRERILREMQESERLLDLELSKDAT